MANDTEDLKFILRSISIWRIGTRHSKKFGLCERENVEEIVGDDTNIIFITTPGWLLLLTTLLVLYRQTQQPYNLHVHAKSPGQFLKSVTTCISRGLGRIVGEPAYF